MTRLILPFISASAQIENLQRSLSVEVLTDRLREASVRILAGWPVPQQEDKIAFCYISSLLAHREILLEGHTTQLVCLEKARDAWQKRRRNCGKS